MSFLLARGVRVSKLFEYVSGQRENLAWAEDEALLSDDDCFEVVGGNRDWTRVCISVISLDQRDQAVIQRGSSFSRKRFKGAQRWSVVGTEELDVFLGGPEAKNCRPRVCRD